VTGTALRGRGAVVTGGGRGIGAAVARALADAGAAVLVAARTTQEVERVAGGLTRRGARAWAVECDVTDPDGVRRLVGGAARLGTDILINNAAPRCRPRWADHAGRWNRMFAVNATSFLCTQAVCPA
jgi:NAD(P)-dependent dehydrogenase (short-subunit alcohol dehydrogenase family)